jgi:Bacterial CdiA-CT RNAse A domain
MTASFISKNPRMLDTRDGSFDMELQQMRCELAALDVELKLCRLGYLLRKFSADQPRVPPGSPEGGQWTSGTAGGGGADDSTDGGDDAQIELVQGDRLQGYPVDLREEERQGGHTIEEHVAKSEPYLKTRVQQLARDRIEQEEDPRGLRAGSFTSLQSATRLINSTLSQNRDIIEEVISGQRGRTVVTAVFDSPTGYEAYLPTPSSIPYMRDTYGVGVLIGRDPGSPNGYRVHTAYPRY